MRIIRRLRIFNYMLEGLGVQKDALLAKTMFVYDMKMPRSYMVWVTKGKPCHVYRLVLLKKGIQLKCLIEYLYVNFLIPSKYYTTLHPLHQNTVINMLSKLTGPPLHVPDRQTPLTNPGLDANLKSYWPSRQGLSQQGVQVSFWHPGPRKTPLLGVKDTLSLGQNFLKILIISRYLKKKYS